MVLMGGSWHSSKEGWLCTECVLFSREREELLYFLYLYVWLYISACIIPLTNLIWRKTVAVGVVELVDATLCIG